MPCRQETADASVFATLTDDDRAVCERALLRICDRPGLFIQNEEWVEAGGGRVWCITKWDGFRTYHECRWPLDPDEEPAPDETEPEPRGRELVIQYRYERASGDSPCYVTCLRALSAKQNKNAVLDEDAAFRNRQRPEPMTREHLPGIPRAYPDEASADDSPSD